METAADACRMEHVVSRESYEALKNLAAETMEGKENTEKGGIQIVKESV